MKPLAPALVFVTALSAAELHAEPAVPRPSSPDPAPSATPVQGPSILDEPGEGPRVLVELRGPAGAAFMRANPLGWGSICHAPCRARVPRSAEYKVLVPGWRPTHAFKLSKTSNAVRLDVTPASEVRSVLGQSLAWLGVAALIGGLVTVAVVDTKAGDTAGLVIAGGGVLSLGIGIPLAVSGAHSSVTPTPIAPTARLLAVRGAF